MKDKYAIEERVDHLYDRIGHDDPSPVERGRINALDWVLGNGDPIGDDEDAKADEAGIRKVIEELKQTRTKYPRFSTFGDPNWDVADAQVEILEWVLAP
jgi:hypothetical protein